MLAFEWWAAETEFNNILFQVRSRETTSFPEKKAPTPIQLVKPGKQTYQDVGMGRLRKVSWFEAHNWTKDVILDGYSMGIAP